MSGSSEMKESGFRVSSKQSASATASVEPGDDLFNDASAALRRALRAVRALELRKPLESLELEGGINFYARVSQFEIILIRYALMKAEGNQSRAASFLGLNKTTLNAKIKAYRIDWRDP